MNSEVSEELSREIEADIAASGKSPSEWLEEVYMLWAKDSRRLHKAILYILGKVDCEDEAECVLCRAEVLELRLDGFEREQIEDALRELEGEGVIIGKHDANGASYALAKYKEMVEAEEAEYEALKTRVYAAAQRFALSPKWKPSEGWRLVGASGELAARGNMRELEEYLSGLASTPER